MREQEISPFLHRDERRQYRPSRSSLEREAQDEERAKSRLTLEKLRYKRCYVRAVDLNWRIIQRTGDFARQYWVQAVLMLYAAWALRSVFW